MNHVVLFGGLASTGGRRHMGACQLGADFTGYNFWPGKLNQFNGNFIGEEMVKAFISSLEYRGRFGP